MLVILGPTGVGKTEKTLTLAERLGIPVINADSRQIYREIPIGTSAPTPEMRRRVRHYFVGTHSLRDCYSAAQYETDVLRLLEELFKTSDYALMSGGSMMYIDAVCKGIDDIPTVDKATRDMLLRQLEAEGLPSMLLKLKALDPQYYDIVDRNNPRRVLHALEICHISGKTYTSFRQGVAKRRPFRIVKIGLNRPRAEMYERINGRVLQMVAQGLEQEARNVCHLQGNNALNTIGYKEMFRHFRGEVDFDEAVRQIQSNTRRYMRKQLTWFRHDETVSWHHPDDEITIQ